MTTKEYSAYIKGLLEGLQLDQTKPETKVINALCGIIEQMADDIDTLKADTRTLHDYAEELDEDLGALEEMLYDEADCDCCDDEDEDCCCGCHQCDEDDDDDDEDDSDFYCAMCPHCGEKVYFDDTIDPEDILCPACHKPLVDDSEDADEQNDL
ncbi:MAG: hypothetical protein IJ480_09270 [Clostridia bacterium]|nr:hypothetical protein [Clostridia bacterium]